MGALGFVTVLNVVKFDLEVVVLTLRLKAVKTGGTIGRQAAVMIKSFSILFHNPMWMAFVKTVVRSGVPSSEALLVTLTTPAPNALHL
jgi:hypothetical protein